MSLYNYQTFDPSLLNFRWAEDFFNFYEKSAPTKNVEKSLVPTNISYKQYISKSGDGVIEVELPGITRESVNVEVVDNKICLKYIDRGGNTKQVSYPVLKQFDLNAVDVVLKDGLLTISIKPKSVEKTTRKLVVR